VTAEATEGVHMIKLYGISRSRALRCLWMLEELGVPYESVKVSFADGGTRKPEFLKVNPNGHIPALDDDGVVLFESLAINLYLARKYDGGKGLWPGSVADEGRLYQWSVWAMTELEEPLLTNLMHKLILPEAQRDAAKAADALERAKKPLGVLDGALAGRDYLLGGAFTAADLNVAGVMSFGRLAKIDLAPTANVKAWLERCWARPATARAMAA
jgi:glutathione S-transferase